MAYLFALGQLCALEIWAAREVLGRVWMKKVKSGVDLVRLEAEAVLRLDVLSADAQER